MSRWLGRKITRTRLRAFLEAHASDAYTLDIGASESAYAQYFPNRVSLDVDEGKNPDVVGDAHELPFEDASFEQVLCTEVLEHLHTPQQAIDEMYRVLKPGGRLILTTRFIYPLHDSPHDYFRFTKYGLRHLLREFEIEELQEEGSTLEAIAVLWQTLGYKVAWRGGKLTRALVFLNAKLIPPFSIFMKEQIASGRNAPKMTESNLMTSGYYVVCAKR